MEDLNQRIKCKMIEQINLHKYLSSSCLDVIINNHAIKLNENHKLQKLLLSTLNKRHITRHKKVAYEFYEHDKKKNNIQNYKELHLLKFI